MARTTEQLLEDILQQLKTSGGGSRGDGGARSRTSGADDQNQKEKEHQNFITKKLDEKLKKQADYMGIVQKIAKEEEKIVKLKSENNQQETINDRLVQNLLKLETLRRNRNMRMNAEQKKAYRAQLEALKDENKKLLDQEKVLERISELNNQKLDIERKFNEENKKALKRAEILEKIKKSKKLEGLKDYMKDMRDDLLGFRGGVIGFLKKAVDLAFEQDSAMSKLSANYAFTRKESERFKVNMGQAALSTTLIGVTAIDLAKSQAAYTDELGRSVMLSREGLISMAEMGVATSLGAEGASKMAAEMELFGYGVVDSSKSIEGLMLSSKRMGLSSSAMAKKFQENLKVANSYTFKNGIEGVKSMTMFSTKFRINMQSIASLADKIATPEGAIETAANLQVLGGAFSSLADPMTLLNQGINDMEGLTKTYEKMLDGVAKIDKETGEVTIGGYDRIRLKAASEALGVSLEEMMSTARTKAKRKAIEADFNLNPVLKGNDEAMDIVASLAQFDQKNKEYKVTIGGKAIPIASLSKENIDALQPKDDSLNLRTVAENTLGLKDTIQNGFNMIAQVISDEILPLLSDITEVVMKGFRAVSNIIGKDGVDPFGGIGKGIKGLKIGGKLASAGAKTLLTSGGKAGLKAGLKSVPVLGTAISLGFAIKDAFEGDWAGTGMQLGSAAASLFPGIGTGLSVAIDLADAARELKMGPFDNANDLLIPSKGRPIKLNSADDVLAMKPNGAVMKAINPLSQVYNSNTNITQPLSPSTNVSKTFRSANPGYSNVTQSGRNSNTNVGGTISLNLQGSINLNGGTNSTKISATELVKDKNFVRELTRIITSQMNRDENGSKFAGGLNNNSFI